MQQCFSCARQFSKPSKRLGHELTHIPWFMSSVICTVCCRRFDSVGKLRIHVDTAQHQKRLLCHQPVDISTHRSSYLKNNCLSSDLVEKIGTTATTEHDIQPTPAITTELETTPSGHQPSSPASAASLSKFISVCLEGPGAVPMAGAQPQSQLQSTSYSPRLKVQVTVIHLWFISCLHPQLRQIQQCRRAH